VSPGNENPGGSCRRAPFEVSTIVCCRTPTRAAEVVRSRSPRRRPAAIGGRSGIGSRDRGTRTAAGAGAARGPIRTDRDRDGIGTAIAGITTRGTDETASGIATRSGNGNRSAIEIAIGNAIGIAFGSGIAAGIGMIVVDPNEKRRGKNLGRDRGPYPDRLQDPPGIRINITGIGSGATKSTYEIYYHSTYLSGGITISNS